MSKVHRLIKGGELVSFMVFYNGHSIGPVRTRRPDGTFYDKPYDRRIHGSPGWQVEMLGKGWDNSPNCRHGRVTCVYPLTNEVDVRDSRGHTWRMRIRESRWLWD